MKQKEPHPHDQLFKQALGRKEVMLDFLANRLPQEVFSQINQESLRLTNKTFAGKVKLRGESDLIFQATINNQPGYIYFIAEHQSEIDQFMPLRFLEYNVRLMRQHISEDGHKRLPVILNICIYNGKKAYDGPTNLLDMCTNPDWVRQYMFQSFQLVDLNRETDTQLLKDKKAAFVEMLLQQGIYRDFYTWLQTHEQIFLDLLKTGNIPYAEAAFHYILQVDTDEQVEEKLATLNPVVKELAMSAAQRLRQEGEQLGVLKGRQEGRQEGSLLIARNMLDMGLDIDVIVQATGLSREEIEKL